MAVGHVYNQTVADGTATSVVRPSDWNSVHNQTVTLSGNTAGQSTFSGTNVVWQGGNNVTLSAVTAAGAATVVVSAPNAAAQSYQPVAFSASGGSSTANTLTFANSNGLTFSNSNGSIVASYTVPTQTVESQSFGISNLGNTSGTSGIASGAQVAAFLAGGNNITLSQSVNGASVTITVSAASVSAGSDTFGMSNLGNTAGTSGVVSGDQVRVLFAGGNNVTLSQSINGVSATITISGPNTAAQSQQAMAFSASGGSSTALTLTFANSNGLTFSNSDGSIVASYTVPTQSAESQSIGISNLGNTSGTSGVASGPQVAAFFAGGNNVTLSQSINGASVTITISAASQSADSQSIGMSNLGNTSGTSGIASGDQVRFLFAGGNNITLSQSINGASGTITISAFTQTQQAMAFSASGGSSTALTMTFANSNGMTFSNSGGSIIASYTVPTQTVESQTIGISNLGNTSGTTGVASGGQVAAYFAGGSNVTLSQSVNGASATITISAGALLSQLEPFPFGNNSAGSILGQSSLYLQPFIVPEAISFCRIDMLGSLSVPNITGGTNTSGGQSNSWGLSRTYGLFTRMTGTDNTRMSLLVSTTWSLGVSNSVSINTGGATTVSLSATNNIGCVSAIGTDGAYTMSTLTMSGSTSSGTSSVTFSNRLTGATGVVMQPFALATSLSAGVYWLGILGITSSTSAGTNLTQATYSNIIQTNLAAANKLLGSTVTSQIMQLNLMHGVFTAQTAAMPNSIGSNGVSQASNYYHPFWLKNVSL